MNCVVPFGFFGTLILNHGQIKPLNSLMVDPSLPHQEELWRPRTTCGAALTGHLVWLYHVNGTLQKRVTHVPSFPQNVKWPTRMLTTFLPLQKRQNFQLENYYCFCILRLLMRHVIRSYSLQYVLLSVCWHMVCSKCMEKHDVVS